MCEALFHLICRRIKDECQLAIKQSSTPHHSSTVPAIDADEYPQCKYLNPVKPLNLADPAAVSQASCDHPENQPETT